MVRRSVFALLALALAAPGPAIADDGFPVSVANCGEQVTIPAVPERLFVVNASDLPILAAVDGLGLVVARTGALVESVYGADTLARIHDIPVAATEVNATGGSVVSLETVLAAQPDLVLAPVRALDRGLLLASGIPMYSPPAFCLEPEAGHDGRADFDLVFQQVQRFGDMLGRGALADAAIAELQGRVEDLAAEGEGRHGSGVAIYVGSERSLYAYGRRSMVQPVFTTAGLENIFAETDDRVFDVSVESLLALDPETVVLLYSDRSPDVVLSTFLSVPGIDRLSAVANDRTLTLPFPYTDPPTPLSIEGAVVLSNRLDALD